MEKKKTQPVKIATVSLTGFNCFFFFWVKFERVSKFLQAVEGGIKDSRSLVKPYGTMYLKLWMDCEQNTVLFQSVNSGSSQHLKKQNKDMI